MEGPETGESRMSNLSRSQRLLTPSRLDPCIIVVAGASGDLAFRKLMPAFYHLYLTGAMPDPFVIVGCARTKMSNEEFGKRLHAAFRSNTAFDLGKWKAFSSYVHYRAIDYEDLTSFRGLGRFLKELDAKHHTKGNRLFYLAVPPSAYKTVAGMIGDAGLAAEGQPGHGWSRVVVEKPFGKDLKTARELNQSLHRHFAEHQIFRIDHYLAKETVQNLLMFRFANSIFEPVWSRNYIDYVSITAAEKIGVGHRGGFYEETGVLRDMFQNHMLQLLAHTAMEPPALFDAEQVRNERIKVFRALRPFPVDRLRDRIVLGRYERGEVDGEKVPGYREEPGVDPNSLTPTFAMMKVFLDNWRWKGVPFYLASGKRLSQKLTEINIQFKEVPHSMFSLEPVSPIKANRLTLSIYPEEKISLTFQTKNPGVRVFLRGVNMDFFYYQNYSGPTMDAYEKLVIDCMLGDQMLFWGEEGVELCWSFLIPIIEECETCADREKMLLPYAAGTWGPKAAARLNKDWYGDSI
jgi:glucose-6-phosphate 1-dehydrogenase